MSEPRLQMSRTCSLDTLGRLADALEVEEIAGLGDDTLRNYLITFSYHLLDAKMRRHIGPNLSWVGFGAWASELAGRCIRGEQVPLGGLLPTSIVARVSRAVARGNRWVYADIAPVFRDFDRLLSRASDGERADLARLAAEGGDRLHGLVREALRLDPRPQAEGGQALLCAAFEQYLLAAHERDPDAQAERVFVANAAVGLHEQRHLDPMIHEMLSFPLLNRVARATLAPLFRVADFTRPARTRVPDLSASPLARRALERFPALGRVAEASREARGLLRQVRERPLTYVFSTRFVLALPIGADLLPVGRDVSPHEDGAAFPEHLRQFDTDDRRFRALLADVLAWDRTPDSLAGSAAGDWSDLADRMNFILDLFRSRQQNPALFANPLGRATR